MMRIKQQGIRRILTGTVSALLLHSSARANIIPADVVLWAGAGANESLLVIDWQDSSDALLWGFRWNGSATGEDMLTAIEALDPRLTADITVGGFGAFFNSIGFDSDQDGTDESYAISDWSGGTGPTTTSWGYYDGGTTGSSWTNSNVGMSSRNLSPGSVDGWSYGTHDDNWSHGAPPSSSPIAASFTAIPEPSVLASFLGGLLLLRLRQHRS